MMRANSRRLHCAAMAMLATSFAGCTEEQSAAVPVSSPDARTAASIESRLVTVRSTGIVPNQLTSVLSARCPADSKLLGGGCSAPPGQVTHLVLQQSSDVLEDELSWSCTYRNDGIYDLVVGAVVHCLLPAP